MYIPTMHTRTGLTPLALILKGLLALRATLREIKPTRRSAIPASARRAARTCRARTRGTSGIALH